MLKPRKRNSAFSLIEVIISAGILSAGIVTVLQAYSFSARVAGLSCDMTKAVFLAEDKFQEMEFAEKQKKTKGEIGHAQGKTDKFQWNSDLSFDNELNLYRLNFDINWKISGRNEKISLDSYLR